ncbi:MAG: hypothetical protein DRP58_04795 [Spirochaetes bacterium]|nr:MAG: hypothetical protein DRP58_04795 [Spirochaetota bacterium]
MSSTKTPFYYGGVAEENYFCNRVEEIEVVKKDINNGLNILIYAPRRFGKTSLVLKALKELNNRYIFIDLMGITDEIEFINAYFNAISISLETTTEKTVRYFKKVLKIRPNINITFDMEGSPSYSLSFTKSEKGNVLEEIMNIPFEHAKHSKEKPIVVLDEFQEVSKLNLEEKLRSLIQLHGNKVSYIFLGSKKSIMQKLFFNKNSAFYKSVKHLPIKGIASSEWSSFIKKGFKNNGKKISDKFIKNILSISKGFPYYTQQIAYELYNSCEPASAVDDIKMKETLRSVLDREEDLFLQEWENLSINQRKALKLIITANGENLYEGKIMDQFNMNSSILKKAVEGLVNKDVIDKSGKRYYMQDPMFEYYLHERLL